MLEIENWLAAFPIRPTTDAVEALLESWRDLAREWRPHFNRKTKEPRLTRVLKAHVERVTGPKRGLLGMWASEAVHNEIDFRSGEIIDERRTDIVYGWNNEDTAVQLVFEFKKVSQYANSRRKYLGDDGLGRFVAGVYAQGQPVAVMVGIVLSTKEKIVPRLQDSLSDPNTISSLQIVVDSKGNASRQPSQLFCVAEFDTKHYRSSQGGRCDDSIRIAHLFLSFGY